MAGLNRSFLDRSSLMLWGTSSRLCYNPFLPIMTHKPTAESLVGPPHWLLLVLPSSLSVTVSCMLYSDASSSYSCAVFPTYCIPLCLWVTLLLPSVLFRSPHCYYPIQIVPYTCPLINHVKENIPPCFFDQNIDYVLWIITGFTDMLQSIRLHQA